MMRNDDVGRVSLRLQNFGSFKAGRAAQYFCFKINEPGMDAGRARTGHSVRQNGDAVPLRWLFDLWCQHHHLVPARDKCWRKMLELAGEVLMDQ